MGATWSRFTATADYPFDGYRLSDRVEVTDNGGGPGSGGGRWALMIDGRWVANIDTLADAKRRGEQA